MTVAHEPYIALRLAIGEHDYDAQARASRPVLDPATGRVIGALPLASIDDLTEALATAERGFARWRRVSAYDRSIVLSRAAGLLRERVESIARILTLEEGKPIAESRLEVHAAADIFQWAGEEGRRAYGTIVPARSADLRQSVLREPIGPVAAFTPWNFPALTPARKLAGALGAGCSIVLKPAEETPGTALALLAALRDAGLPADAASIVFGDPAQVSQVLIESPIVRKISFTGSTAVGALLAKRAAAGPKPATLELGGHAPVIVCAGVDLESTVEQCVAFKFRNAGQVCTSPTRFLVAKTIAEDFTARFAARAAALRHGHGLDEATQIASLANARRREGIAALVDDAREHGADVAAGGSSIADAGFSFEPTVLTRVPRDARVLNEEPFGPVAVIEPFDSLDAAIAEANRLPYGLAAYAFATTIAECDRLSDGIETGMLAINHFGVSVSDMPFGGVKASGYGSEGGPDALAGYLVTKAVSIKTPRSPN